MINRLTLYQFKGFIDQQFNFSELTLLTGINGMGKSSVIQSLLILRNSFDRNELQQGKALTIVDKDLVNLISPDAMLNADASSNDVCINLLDDDTNVQWKVSAVGQSNTLPLIDHSLDENIFSCALFQESFQYLNAERIGPRQFYDRKTTSSRHSPLGYRGEYTAAILTKITIDIEKAIHPSLSIDGEETIYDQVSSWLSQILHPGTKVNIDESNPNHVSIVYNFAKQKGKSFNPLNIGFGFSFALPVIVAVLTAPKGSLLIVENPEAHLHPKGQAEMGKFLALAAEAGIQIIIETHSDHILNGIRIAVKEEKVSNETVGVIFVGSYEDKGVLKVAVQEPTIDSDGRIEDWPKDFFDTWEYSMMSLL
ncbi:DUF3696 domain-containing protein [Sphingobacterium multivorum]|nr:DUF3696 domain-containing protein [Sphingobacterium multivorum]QQT33066.1 DUF3696 domain-containing protein [Sphingobacterium multivorum]